MQGSAVTASGSPASCAKPGRETIRYGGSGARNHQNPASGNPQPFGTRIHRHRTQHQMGHRHHVCSDGRALVLSLYRAGFVFRPLGELVHEPSAGSPPCGPGGVNGGVAAAWPGASHSAFRSRLPVYVGGVPALLSGTPQHVQYECGGELCRNAAAESFFGLLKRERVHRRQYRTRAEARVDIFEYIERWHNPRQHRRLVVQGQEQKRLTQLSVETG